MNKWDSKRIAFIAILIAMSISFVIIGTRFVAITSFPSLKLSLAGLPIKIIGFIFGPVIGFITGFTTDVISFIFMPAFYFPLYSVALGVSGMLPGLSAIFFNYFYKKLSRINVIKRNNMKLTLIFHEMKISLLSNDQKKFQNLEKKYHQLMIKNDKIKEWKNEKYQLNFGLISSITLLLIVMFVLTVIIHFIPQSHIDAAFNKNSFLSIFTNKLVFIAIIALGIITSIGAILIARFKMKQNNFLQFVCIVTFVVFTEYLNIPIIAYADEKGLKLDFEASMIASLATSMIKIWFNLVIISFSIKIVLPLINKKTFNGY